MELVLDTKSKLGTLKSKRTFIIDDFGWDKLIASCATASPAKAARAERQLVSQYHRRLIKPGEIVLAREAQGSGGCGCGCSGASGCQCSGCGNPDFNGKAAWYPDKNGVRIKVAVVDSKFAARKQSDLQSLSSYVVLCASLPGSKGVVTSCAAAPMGAGGKAMTIGSKLLTATWKKTKTGYNIEAKLPWKLIKGAETSEAKNRTFSSAALTGLLPVSVTVNQRTNNGTQNITTDSDSGSNARSFVILKLKK